MGSLANARAPIEAMVGMSSESALRFFMLKAIVVLASEWRDVTPRMSTKYTPAPVGST